MRPGRDTCPIASESPYLNEFVEQLERYSREEDHGHAAYGLHWLSRRLFGATIASGPGAFTDPDLSERITTDVPSELDMPMVVPLADDGDLAFASRILEKTTLYSGFTAFVLPQPLRTSYLTYSASHMIRVEDKERTDHLLMANFFNADLVRRGRCVFLPSESLFQEESVSHYDETRVRPPLRQAADDISHQPLNAASLRPDIRLADALVAYKRVVLPFFPGVDLQLLAEVAEAEGDAFRRFTARLSRAFARVDAADDESTIEAVHDELDEGVERVKREARRLAEMRAFRDIELGWFAVTLAIATQPPAEAVGLVAGVTGSATGLDLLRSHLERRSVAAEMRRDDFFVPWLMDGLSS